MNDGSIRRHYGFGVARLALPVEPRPRRDRPLRTRELLREIAVDAVRSGGRGLVLRMAGRASALGIAGLIAMGVLLWLPVSDAFTPTRMVWLEGRTPPVAPPLAIPEPAAREAPPKPEPVEIAALAPPSVDIADPAPPAAAPIFPVIDIDPIAPRTRASSLPGAALYAAVRPSRSVALPDVGIDAVAVRRRPATGELPLTPTPPAAPRRLPSVSSAPRPDLELPAAHPRTTARVRRPPAVEPDRFSRETLADAASTLPEVLAPEAPRVAARRLTSRGSTRSRIRGVPLASFASCTSDAEEDHLKEQLLAAALVQVECNSDAGTYRFLETKNLNAFLMWVDRNPDRPALNRCGELRLALSCLAETRPKESRES